MNTNKKTILALLVSGIFFSGFASAVTDDEMVSSLNNTGVSAAKPAEKDVVTIDEGLSTELTASERELIDKKRHSLVKYLYEQQELDSARKILSEDNRKSAYEETKRDRIPLSPDEILELRRMDNDAKRAENSPIRNSGVKLEIRTLDLDVDAPKPIILNVAPGYASSIVFYDQTGAPWPIDGDIIGDAESFGSKGISKQKHIAVFEITREFAQSNALINLEGLSVPIVVKLVGHDGVVDSRLSIRIPKMGPGAEIQPFVHDQLENASADMLNVLNGDKISGSKRFELVGVPGEVTYKDDTLFIRTRANLISPPWKRSVVSPTGYKVYELPPVTNLLFSVDGEMKNATIEKAFDVKITQSKSIFSE
ncbi:hypothetical protein D3C81_520900 [compost metagenome]